MFDCRACAAKDAEIARLWKALTEANDRFQALTGTLSEVANARDLQERDTPPTVVPTDQQDSRDRDAQDFAVSEIGRTRLDLKRRGVEIRPDFPEG